MRVLMFGMFDRTYPRNRVVLQALARQGMQVQVCHEPSWELQRDKVRGYAGLWNRCKLVLRVLWAQLRLLVRWLTHRWHAEVIWVGFPGHADMPLAWFIGKCTGRPVVFDAFISWYDSAVRDRELFPKRSFTARLLRWFDYVSCHLADRVVVDTPEHAAFFQRMFRLPARKVTWIAAGADEEIFHPGPEAERREGPDRSGASSLRASDPADFRVLQYAEYTPLHGGEYVLDAAHLLQQRGVPMTFELVGDDGPFFEKLKERAAALRLRNVEFESYVPEAELVRRAHAADVCLGVFGGGAKARRVIPNKVWQCLAMGRPLVTGDTLAIRRVFEPGRDLLAVPPADGAALAEALDRLRMDPRLRNRLAGFGRQRFLITASLDAIGHRMQRELRAAAAAHARKADALEATDAA